MKWPFLKMAPKASADMLVADERQDLLEELKRAHGDWMNAQQRLDWVVEKDQIDYAIYALEAAEKKYEMLLRQAKQMPWNVSHMVWRKGS
jgi:hypothetical protein